MTDRTAKFERFRALHQQDRAFVMPNPWDAGTARLLEHLGFDALATTSAGHAFSRGKLDSAGSLTRDQILANAAEIAAATGLPVSADLENGFGATPAACAETIRLAAGVGLVGGSIEDATGERRCASVAAVIGAIARMVRTAETQKASRSGGSHGVVFLGKIGCGDRI